MMTKEQADTIDLLISTLREHEKELDREIEELRKLRRLSDPAIQSVVTAIVYAIQTELKDMDRTTTRLFVSEFFHSLNRKKIISNEETSALIQEAYEKLDVK